MTRYPIPGLVLEYLGKDGQWHVADPLLPWRVTQLAAHGERGGWRTRPCLPGEQPTPEWPRGIQKDAP